MRLLRVALVLALLGLLWAPRPARAAGGSQALCVAQWKDTVTPGASLVHGRSSLTSGGQTGTIACVGEVRGHPVTGLGTFGEVGSAEGTCLSGSGAAVFMMTIPTAGGPVGIVMPAVFTLAGNVGMRPTGDFPGGFVFVPTRGDCVLSPVTEIAVVLHGTLHT